MKLFLKLKVIFSLAALLSFTALAAEPPTEPILRIEIGEHTALIKRIATDDAGRYLVTASDDKTAKVWDLKDAHLLSTLRIPIGNGHEGKLYAAALSPDGKTVALGGYTQVGESGTSIFLFDRASGRMLRRLSGLSEVIRYLAFSPNGQLLGATLWGEGLRLFSVADGRLIAEDKHYDDQSPSVQFSHDGRLLTTSLDGFIRLYRYDGSTLSLLAKRSAPGGKQPYDARFSPDGQHIAVGFLDTPAVNVLNAADLSLAYAPDTAGVNANLGIVAWSRDGATLSVAGQAQKSFNNQWQQYIRSWRNSAAGVDIPAAGNTIMDLVPLPGRRLAFVSGEPSWGVMDSTGKRTLFHALKLANFRNLLSGLTLSADGTQVHFGYENYGESPAVFDIMSHAFLPSDTASLTPPSLNNAGIDVTDWKDTTEPPKLNGTPLKLGAHEYSRSLAMMTDGFVLGTDSYLRAFDRTGKGRWHQDAPAIVCAVNVSRDGRWIVAAYGDGTIRWHRASDGVEQLAFFPHADKKRWVMWTPSGYYDASPGGEELIGWHVNRGKDQAADFFPASRFRDRFYRPDVLTKILTTQDEASALQQANEESGRRTQTVSVAQVLPPVVEILSPVEGTQVSTSSVTLRYNVRTDTPVTGIRVRVNGQAIPDVRGLGVTKAAADTREVTVPIPEQNSEIQLFAENKNGVSVPATLRVTWAGKKAAPVGDDNRFKPKLYVLAVGVSQYKNPDLNLGLPAKDAKDFARVFEQQKGKLYGDVVVQLLTDEQASKDKVIEGLEWLKSQVTAKDVGVMFIAGHGMNDNQGKYFFMPYNANPDKLMSTGVAQTDIRDTLNSLAGKVLFFVDTCHAGNALGTGKTRAVGGSTDAFINELASAENGVIVFSSSTGRQLSQEDSKWGNGAFTKAVVEGLRGKAEINNSGKVTLKGLDYYVVERVKELTHGQQSPVSIAPGGITDFPIAVTGR